jgi:hypothetical protein
MGKSPARKFWAEFEIANGDDLAVCATGDLESAKIRRKTVRGIVNPNVMRMILPGALAKELGLPTRAHKVKVLYPDRHWHIRSLVEGVNISMLGRQGTFSAVVVPRADTIMLGWMVLNVLDLIVDPTEGRLRPRDPRYVTVEI